MADGPAPTDPPLRIAVLASGLRVGGGLSLGANVIAAMGRVAPENHYFCVVPAGLGYEQAAANCPRHELLTHVHTNYARRWWFETVTVPRAVRRYRPDVVFALSGRALPRPGCAQAAFPQNSYLFYPSRHFGKLEFHLKLMLRYQKWSLARALPWTQLLLVQTPVVERRVRETFAYRGHTLVCGSSVSPFLHAGRTGRPLPAALRPVQDKTRLLYLSRYYAHKNIDGIVDMYRRYGDELRDVVVILTIAPDQYPSPRRILRLIERCGLARRIYNVGAVPHEEVGAYYEHCHAAFMPTLLETFGIPYLEAMHFDLPILTSDLDFSRAVCGDAALYFDPWRPESMRDAILRCMSDHALRQRLIEAGRLRRRQEFPPWDTIAADVVLKLRQIVREYRGQS